MIRTVAETGSTNADLLGEAGSLPEGTWLRAERQTGGRGRLGRTWVSPAGNLYASTLVHLGAGDPPAATLALVAAVALHEAASAWAPGQSEALRIKWPNDLMAGSAKLAGILLERAGDAVVIGFGVNLAETPAGLDRPATTLAAIGGAAADPALFLDDLARAFATWLGRWRAGGVAAIRPAWQARAHATGTPLAAQGRDGARREGLFEDLDASGALRLRLADGTIETIHAGDVFLL